MRKSVLLGMALLLIWRADRAGAQIVSAREPMRLMADCGRFRGSDDNHVLVEVYYSVAQGGLTHAPDSSGYSGAADLTLLIMKNDSAVQGERWLVPSHIQDTAALTEGRNLVGVQDFELDPGEYVLKLVGRDRSKLERSDSVRLKLPIVLPGTEKPALSDIEFAVIIRRGQQGMPFYKNTLSVVPNVGGIYSEKDECYYYAELYNLLGSGDKSDYTLTSAIYDAVGREVTTKESQRKRAGESSVIVDHFSMEKLRSGAYSLQLTIADSAHKLLAARARKLFVFNRMLGVDSSLLAGAKGVPLAQYAGMDEQELDHEFSSARYEANDAERTQYKQLKGAAPKRKFLSDFWRRRPLDRRDHYLSLVEYANQNFHYLGREGFRTDRGRVYIMYGPPDDIERHPSESDSKPYDVWNYHNIEGGVIFVFLLKNPGSDYELVHSTARNELHDENWSRQATTTNN